MLSIVIPAFNEAAHLRHTLISLQDAVSAEAIPSEFIVVDDHSDDETERVLELLQNVVSDLVVVRRSLPRGYGLAVREGLARARGDVIAIAMADGVDCPRDLVAFYKKIQEGYDCVFGSRFGSGGQVVGYPKIKLLMNRLGNTLIRVLFRIRYDDVTNAFKMFRRKVVDGVAPLESTGFELNVELPLKAIVKGYSYAVLPNSWIERDQSGSAFRLGAVGVSNLRIVASCFRERRRRRVTRSYANDT
jgi:dolichol-phosphate mannosyltransferase